MRLNTQLVNQATTRTSRHLWEQHLCHLCLLMVQACALLSVVNSYEEPFDARGLAAETDPYAVR